MSMSSITLEWARIKFRDEVGAFADDPHGYCGDDLGLVASWQRLEHIGQDLGMDVAAILLEDCTNYEIARIERLTGRNFG